MAGTLVYRLRVEHVYQRRFGQAELSEALKSCHWYIVARRPSVRIVEGSANLDDQILTVDVTTATSLAGPRSVHTLGLDFGQFDHLGNFQTYANGAYFSVEVDGFLAHGDAWSLASMLSNADPELAAQEVLYIGEAFGKDGSSNVWRRVRAHEKLQQIYEDHADVDCDIFVVPLSLERRAWISDDHIDDDEDGCSMELYYRYFASEQGAIRKNSVDLIEHSLISYFAPYYNEKLTQWRHDVPTGAMRKMRQAGFRLIQVHLSGWWGLARFFSVIVPDRFRSHLVSHDLPPEPRRPVFRGIAAEKLSDWRSSAMMVREGQELLEEAAERTGATLQVFGQQAPSLRTPPGVVLPKVPPLEEGNRAAQEALRADIAERREEIHRASSPITHPGGSTYDPETGTIATGERPDGSEERRRLHDPSTGRVDSTVVFGESGMGRSNYLLTLLREALLIGLFFPVVADVGAKGEWRKILNPGREGPVLAEGVEGSIELLEKLCRMVDERKEAQICGKPSREFPAVLLGIDDSDALLHDKRGATLVRRLLLEGGEVGVGVVLVVGDVIAFEGRPELMQAIAAADYKVGYMAKAGAVLKYLQARYGPTRARTWGSDDNPLFVLHQDVGDAVLGIAMAWLRGDADESSAKRWARQCLREIELDFISEWQNVGGDPNSWVNMDSRPTRWFLRRHDDVWLLVMAETNMPNGAGSELIEWADSQIHAEFEVELGRWQVGPGTGEPGTAVFYNEGSGGITRKDRSESIKRMIASMY